jgi:hypothetical protein
LHNNSEVPKANVAAVNFHRLITIMMQINRFLLVPFVLIIEGQKQETFFSFLENLFVSLAKENRKQFYVAAIFFLRSAN